LGGFPADRFDRLHRRRDPAGCRVDATLDDPQLEASLTEFSSREKHRGLSDRLARLIQLALRQMRPRQHGAREDLVNGLAASQVLGIKEKVIR